MFEKFDFNALDDREFKEDSVREELIAPIIKRLGYTPTGENKIIRSKAVKHPYCYIGSVKRDINCIPDYLFQVAGQNVFVLDAKAPNEDILKGRNVEQCYSYAIHGDIRVPYYGLCNGRQISIFQIQKYEPVAIIDIKDITDNWNLIERLLSPIAFTKPYIFDFLPDFGLSVLKMNMGHIKTWIFIDVGTNFITKIDEENYTFMTAAPFGENEYGLSFDFYKDLYQSFLNSINPDKAKRISEDLKRNPFHSNLTPEEIRIGVTAELTSEIYSNENEDYLPLKVIEFMKIE